MDTKIEFKKIKTTERNLNLKPTKFSRIFLMDTTITILNDCILFGNIKISLEVKHASKYNNFLVFNTTKSLFLLDFKIKVLYKFEGDEQDFINSEFNGENLEILYSNGIYKSYKLGEILEDKEIEIREEEDVSYFYKGGIINNKVDDNKVDEVLSTPFGDIFILNEKMKLNGKEIENELYFGDNNDKIYYYSASFKDFILLGSSNNSNLYLYDFNLNIIDIEGEDAIYIQADNEHNQLYIRGMDYNNGRLVLIDLKGNLVEYCVKTNNELNDKTEEYNDNLCFKSKILKIQGDKLKIKDCEIEEFKEITKNKTGNLTESKIENLDEKHETKIEKPSIKLSENPEGLSFIQFKKDLLSSDELKEDQTFTDEEISILSKNDKEEGSDEDNKNNVNDSSEIFKMTNLEDNNLKDLKSSMTDIRNNLTDKKSVFGDIKSNLTDKKSNPFSFSFNKENSKSVFEENTKSVFAENTKSVFGNETVSDKSVATVSNQSVFIENKNSVVNKSLFEKASESTFEKSESVKNVFNKDDITKSPLIKNSSFQSKPSSLQSTSLDSVDDIISSILSIKTNSVSINNYKINNITDRLESQIYSSMSKLKRINDIKREIESNLLIMINNLDTFNKIDSKSIEDSMRYFDEVIERKTRHKTPLIYNSPIIEPDLRKINQISTSLEEDLSKLNLNVLTQIKLEPVYFIDKIKIKYNDNEEVKCEKEDKVKEGRPQTNTSFYIKSNPEKETNFKESNKQSQTQPTTNFNTQSTAASNTTFNTIPNTQPTTTPTTPFNTPTITPSIPNPLQPNTQPNPFQSNPSQQPNSSDIFSRVLGSSIPKIQKEENKETNKPPSAFSKFASSHNLFK